MEVVARLRALSGQVVRRWRCDLDRGLVRDVALVCGADALVGGSFGAIAVGAGLPVWAPVLLSVVVFAGASQFLFVALLTGGGAVVPAVLACLLVNTRHLPCGFAIGDVLGPGWLRRLAGSHLLVDETVVFALARRDEGRHRTAFWACGIGLFVCWNVGVLAGAYAGTTVPDTDAFGLDSAFPAVLLALIIPALRDTATRRAALAGAVLAVATAPVLRSPSWLSPPRPRRRPCAPSASPDPSRVRRGLGRSGRGVAAVAFGGGDGGAVGQACEAGQGTAQARVEAQGLGVAVEEGPVAGGERAGVGAEALRRLVPAVAAVVAHAVDVRAAGRVRLGRHEAAVGVLAHADDVRGHHPGVAVDEALVEEVGERLGIVAALQRPVAEDHQARDVMDPAAVADPGEHVGQAGGADGGRVEVGEPVGQRDAGGERVAAGVVLAGPPVDAPDVLAPAEHLADEALDAGDRRVAPPVGVLGGAGDLQRMQQAQVQRRGQGGVGHRRVGGEHRVLVRAEGGEAVPDERVQGPQRLVAGRGEPARPVDPAEPGVPVAFEPVKVVADLGVDVRLDRAPRFGQAEPAPVARRWFAVVVVVVPLSARRLGAVHQNAVAMPLPPVEILHQQPPPARGAGAGAGAGAGRWTAVGPGGELLVARSGEGRRDDGHRGQAGHEAPRRPGGRGGHLQGLAIIGDDLAVGRADPMVAAFAQLTGTVAQRREDQVCLLAVEAPPSEHPGRLDQQDRLVGPCEEVRAELIGKQPATVHPPTVSQRCAPTNPITVVRRRRQVIGASLARDGPARSVRPQRRRRCRS
ncbi:branched chain amino acid efflux pump [Frankia sp. AgKG'84/4]